MGEPITLREIQLEEISRIDFLLNELARAVERGEVHHASYDLMAPRYLARRAELVAIITGQPEPAAAEIEKPGEVPALTPLVTEAHAPESSEGPLDQAEWLEPAVPAWTPPEMARPEKPERVAKPVPWTTILTFLGAFLVVVASAIFAVLTWDIFSVPVKLAGLVVVTVAFYVASEVVNSRLHLRTGAVTLAIVSAAMLLFDCWIVIDGYDLEGPWPWAVALLVCSVAYWGIEVRLGGGIFAVVGAGAQLAWWWMFTYALGLTVPWQMAGIASVGALWTFVGARVPGEGPLRSFSFVLRWGGLGAIAIAAFVATFDALLIGPPTLSQTLACAVVGVAGLVAVWGFDGLPPVAAVVAQVPLAASVFLFSSVEAAWWQVGILGVAAVIYGLYELARGGWAVGILALVAEALFWIVLCDLFGVESAYIWCVVGTVAVSWLFARKLASRVDAREAAGLDSLSRLAMWGGWTVLSAATVLALGEVTALDGAPPLTGVVDLHSACRHSPLACRAVVRREYDHASPGRRVGRYRGHVLALRGGCSASCA